VRTASGELGELVRTHKAAPGKLWLIPLGLALAAGGLLTAFGPFLWPDPRVTVGDYVGLIVLGLPFAALGIGAAVNVWRQRHRRVDVYERGIIEQRGNRLTQVSWDDVASLTCQRVQVRQVGGLVTHNIASYRLLTHAGKKLRLDHLLSDIATLGEEIERQVSRSLLPKVRARLAAGENVEFAPFTLSERGISLRQRTLGWEQLAGAEVARGEVRIFARGEPGAWTRVAYGKLSNAKALLELLSERVQRARS
jgi:uncharacterized protein DUF6585